ncbi:MgtC/SapB transporter [Alkaliphilus metalliredigens QYMF]|uniref:MgtC/SapB transporter n=1 Tax=Alkaliphilus metalliredigens (strain QYMF) TaxID=293826 RepID=A6TMN2_ALKMQ|nr:MgtC/SapB family protein [Alkaliphilus metalliredigens]ABR47450.1 MgtC/SapB transporter [Alkaliphilus metalliredigens QYMF]
MVATGELILRLLLATVLGGIIGFEREMNNRPAGLRTHILVTLGSCLIMLISLYGFQGHGVNGAGGEPARLAAQVVSGIGFLGAGTILREGTNVRGLTTAASIWISGGIGLAVGVGFYLISIIATLLALFSLLGLGVLEKHMVRLKRYSKVKVHGTGRPGFIGEIGMVFGKFHVNIKNIVVENADGSDDEEYEDNIDITFFLRIPSKLNRIQLYNELKEIEGIENVVWDDVLVVHGGKVHKGI